jgi:hypothetical protein
MATGLRVEDKLDGAVNFGAWKCWVCVIFFACMCVGAFSKLIPD